MESCPICRVIFVSCRDSLNYLKEKLTVNVLKFELDQVVPDLSRMLKLSLF